MEIGLRLSNKEKEPWTDTHTHSVHGGPQQPDDWLAPGPAPPQAAAERIQTTGATSYVIINNKHFSLSRSTIESQWLIYKCLWS